MTDAALPQPTASQLSENIGDVLASIRRMIAQEGPPAARDAGILRLDSTVAVDAAPDRAAALRRAVAGCSAALIAQDESARQPVFVPRDAASTPAEAPDQPARTDPAEVEALRGGGSAGTTDPADATGGACPPASGTDDCSAVPSTPSARDISRMPDGRPTAAPVTVDAAPEAAADDAPGEATGIAVDQPSDLGAGLADPPTMAAVDAKPQAASSDATDHAPDPNLGNGTAVVGGLANDTPATAEEMPTVAGHALAEVTSADASGAVATDDASDFDPSDGSVPDVNMADASPMTASGTLPALVDASPEIASAAAPEVARVSTAGAADPTPGALGANQADAPSITAAATSSPETHIAAAPEAYLAPLPQSEPSMPQPQPQPFATTSQGDESILGAMIREVVRQELQSGSMSRDLRAMVLGEVARAITSPDAAAVR